MTLGTRRYGRLGQWGRKRCVEGEYSHFHYCRTRDDRGGTNQDCFAEVYFACVRFELAKQLNLS